MSANVQLSSTNKSMLAPTRAERSCPASFLTFPGNLSFTCRGAGVQIGGQHFGRSASAKIQNGGIMTYKLFTCIAAAILSAALAVPARFSAQDLSPHPPTHYRVVDL